MFILNSMLPLLPNEEQCDQVSCNNPSAAAAVNGRGSRLFGMSQDNDDDDDDRIPVSVEKPGLEDFARLIPGSHPCFSHQGCLHNPFPARLREPVVQCLVRRALRAGHAPDLLTEQQLPLDAAGLCRLGKRQPSLMRSYSGDSPLIVD